MKIKQITVNGGVEVPGRVKAHMRPDAPKTKKINVTVKVQIRSRNGADDPELGSLGTRLREERLKRNEPQAKFAARLGVSVPTYRKMEAGDPTIQIGHWSSALGILNRSDDLKAVLAPKEDLFAKFDSSNTHTRQRAPRRAR